ncbi:hypothetical protein CRUP_019169 [Coryphaenoides rupestris]|nr:hypothetical protein CRUP_019169 [Coryphaenoides rupestris]
MSSLDSNTLATVEPHVTGPCVSKDFFWTRAEVKDGLVDQMRDGEGEGTWGQRERLSELQAALEALGFLVYQKSMARRRYELSRAVLENRRFSLLGSRRVVCLDYMSTLRSICHHHHRRLQEQDRFQHYLRSIHLGLSKATMRLLAQEYMES